jgi:hypothetical protein
VRYRRSHRHVDGNALAVLHSRSQPHRGRGQGPTGASRGRKPLRCTEIRSPSSVKMKPSPSPLRTKASWDSLLRRRVREGSPRDSLPRSLPTHRAGRGRARHADPIPTRAAAELRGPSLALRTDAPPPSPNAERLRAHRIRPWCLPTLASSCNRPRENLRGGAGSVVDETTRPLIHPRALLSVSTPTSGASPTAARAIGCPPTFREQPRRQDMQRRR